MIKFDIVDKLYSKHELKNDEYLYLLITDNTKLIEYLHEKAREVQHENFGNGVYKRGLIEFTNYCKNSCYYCGINTGNKKITRYRLTEEEILSSCTAGYELGFKTFVLQGGEDPYFKAEKIEVLIKSIKKEFPDCALTLSFGEHNTETYKQWYDAGADRYLLRHETANSSHYNKLHPDNLSLNNRLNCLKALKEIGYQTGTGFMVGSPYQTDKNIIEDLNFIASFKPKMIGIGPFIPHEDTIFKEVRAGSVEKTLRLISILRLMLPKVLLPATTALGTAKKDGRIEGILAGANVVMPNLTPAKYREHYALYDNKICTGAESAQNNEALKNQIEKIGYKLLNSRGDYKN